MRGASWIQSRPGRGSAAGRRGGAGLKLLIALVVVFAMLSLVWMLFLPVVLTTQLRQRTGFDATVKSVAVNPFTGTVSIEGLVVTNPPTFPVKDFLDLRSFTADAEVLSLLTNQPVISSLKVDVASVTLVKRASADTNANVFSNYMTAGPEALPMARDERKGFLIRHLTVKIDEVKIEDYTSNVPATQYYKLSFNQSYTDVTGVKQLLAPSTLQGLLPLGSALNGLLPGAFGQAVREVVRDAAKAGGNLLKNTGQTTGDKIKGYFDALEESKKP